mmetsp:Transcript_23009/g.74989  ORF Transcript_23009/g.74989 Transcript_23009/m.74989 type:complete len:471 (-) Transcript_23009:60-1472(-)
MAFSRAFALFSMLLCFLGVANAGFFSSSGTTKLDNVRFQPFAAMGSDRGSASSSRDVSAFDIPHFSAEEEEEPEGGEFGETDVAGGGGEDQRSEMQEEAEDEEEEGEEVDGMHSGGGGGASGYSAEELEGEARWGEEDEPAPVREVVLAPLQSHFSPHALVSLLTNAETVPDTLIQSLVEELGGTDDLCPGSSYHDQYRFPPKASAHVVTKTTNDPGLADPGIFSECRLLLGRSDWSGVERLQKGARDRRINVMLMMRDPTALRLSRWRRGLRVGPGIVPPKLEYEGAPADFQHPMFLKWVHHRTCANPQMRALVGINRLPPLSFNNIGRIREIEAQGEARQIQVAKKHMRDALWVGVGERFQESMCVLSWKLGVPPIEIDTPEGWALQGREAAYIPIRPGNVTFETVMSIREQDFMDQELYAYAIGMLETSIHDIHKMFRGHPDNVYLGCLRHAKLDLDDLRDVDGTEE